MRITINRLAQAGELVVVLVRTRNPLNIGAAARAMSNFGFHSLRLVSPYEPSFREARSAVGAAEVLAKAAEFGTVADAVADCTLVVGTTTGRKREPHQPLVPVTEAARRIRRHAGRTALLFGSEKRGLSNDDLARCHWLLRISTREEHPSMNLGQAVAVCLYEIMRGSKQAEPEAAAPLATAAEVERISLMLVDILRESGYMKANAAAAEQKVRRLVRRMRLAPSDAQLWMGMLRQIGWKLRH